jgi:hypothetical protein
MGYRHQDSVPSLKELHMEFFHSLMQLDWTRAVRFWLLVGVAVSAWTAALLFGRAFATYRASK